MNVLEAITLSSHLSNFLFLVRIDANTLHQLQLDYFHSCGDGL